MKKTDMMLKYEQETRETLDMSVLSGDATGSWYGYIDMVEAKAEAYDRLMSGKGKMTMKEMANFIGKPITIDNDCTVKAHWEEPRIIEENHGAGYWANDADDYVELPESMIVFNGDWKDSLTFPDGMRKLNERLLRKYTVGRR